MAANNFKSYEEKAVTRKQAVAYQSFGWVRSNQKLTDIDIKKKKTAEVLVKRKLEFAENPTLANYEREYLKLEKKKYRQKPILGILSFILMLAFLVFAGVELYYGISAIVDNKKQYPVDDSTNTTLSLVMADAANDNTNDAAVDTTDDATANDTTSGFDISNIKGILDTVKKDYFSYVTKYFEGTTNEETGEYTEGFVDKIANAIGDPVASYINSDVFVGLISLILFIIFLIIFCEVAKIKSKRKKKLYRMEELRADAEIIVENMRRNDLSLMGRAERKQYMWQSVIANAIKEAMPMNNDPNDEY